MTTTLTRRRMAVLLTFPLGGLAFTHRLTAAQDATIEPVDGDAVDDLPTSLCLPPEEDDDPDECRRGPVPVNLQIPAIEVDAPVEILETVAGVMQQPNDEVHVAWYKETARMGERGNLLLAGHLNWWGIPKAVFFSLGELREGDEITQFDEEENAFTYTVTWVRQESNLEPPREDVLGMTAVESITLMTCSGEWNNTINEYDQRTVVRAERVLDEDDGAGDQDA